MDSFHMAVLCDFVTDHCMIAIAAWHSFSIVVVSVKSCIHEFTIKHGKYRLCR